MAPNYTPLLIRSQPGIKLDGTMLEGDNYVDGQWCRFQLRKGLPRKMGGYKRLTNELSGITRGMSVFNHDSNLYVHTGWSNGIDRFLLDMNGNVSGISDLTPVGFAADPKNIWQFDVLYDSGALTTVLLANAAPNLVDICAGTATPVYYGDILGTAKLVPTTSPNVAGGIVALGPYAVSFGHDGVVSWSPVNNILGAWTTARPTGAKLVFGLPIRAGAGNGPSGLIWGTEVLLRMTFVGGAAVWNFDTITTQYSIMSSQGVVEYDGIYYWIGIDKFLMFNGVIQEVENSMNLNWFFDNLNFANAQKCFATKIPRWGEIWFCAPLFGATECNYAAILNVRLSRIFGYNVWYHTKLPNGGRSCAQYARVFRSPLFTGVDVDSTTAKYKLWEHEAPGVVDEIDGTKILAIQSYFETNPLFPALPPQGAGTNQTACLEIIEPDFVQSGPMAVTIKGSRGNARSPLATDGPFTFVQDNGALTAEQQIVRPHSQMRQMRLNFESNVEGGDYQMGDTIGQFLPGDGRFTT